MANVHPNDVGASLPPEDDTQSTSSDLTELDPEDFPTYFYERGGRLFHSHGRSPYPLPVDADEQHRLNRQHALLREVLREHFTGPVREVLQPQAGVSKHAVDVGTGTGKWVMDVAAYFPDVQFDGLDIVPIQTRHPLPNVNFIIQDVTDQLQYRNGTIDFVHVRDVVLAVTDYPALLREIGRILKPGGLYLGCEWTGYPSMDNGSDISVHAPHTSRYFEVIKVALSAHGIHSIADNIIGWLQASRVFEQPQQRRFRMPVGNWHRDPREVGKKFREIVMVYAASMKPMLIQRGYLDQEVASEWLRALEEELGRVCGISFTYYWVYARKASV